MVRGRGRGGALTTLLLLIVLGVAACGDDTTETSETTDAAEEGGPEGEAAAPAGDTVLTVYSGRSEELVGPILEEYAQDSGGEVDLGLVNHYYLYRFLEEDPDFPVENSFLTEGDVGNLVNLAGLGVLDTAENPAAAADLVRFLLTEEAQQYFADEVFEFPLVGAVDVDPRLPDIDEVDTPDIDLSDLEDLRGTVELLQEAGALP